MLHVKDKPILKDIKSYLGVGQIYKQAPESLQFTLESLKEDHLGSIITFFRKYKLKTQKRGDCEL